MVRLLELKLRNFKHLRGSDGEEFVLKFPTGVVAIQGPNESGKTTLLQAVCFALFGKRALFRGERLEDLIRFGAKFADVSLTFRVGDTVYQVYRRIARDVPSQARLVKILPDGSLVAQAKTVRAVDEALEEILGLDAETFKSTVIILQKDLKRLLEKDRSQREALINAIMGRECFDIAVDRLKERRREIAGPHGKGGELTRQREKLSQLEELKSRYDEQLRKRSEITKEIEKLKGEIPELREKLSRLEWEVSLLENYEQSVRRVEALKERLDVKEEFKAGLEERRRRLLGEIEECRKHAEAAKEYEENEEELAILRRRRKACREPSILAVGIVGLSMLLVAAILLQIGPTPAALMLAAAGIPPLSFSVKRTLIDFGRLNAKIERLSERQIQLIEDVQRYRKIREVEKELSDVEKQIAKAEKELSMIRDELSNITLPELPQELAPYSPEALKNKREERENILRDVERKSQRLKDLEASLKEVEKFLRKNVDVEERLEKQRRVVQELEQELAVVEEAIELIEGAARDARASVRPAVENTMCWILPRITNGRYGDVELLEDFRIKVYDADAGEFRLMERFSGGTEDQFLLALRLAFTLSLIPKMRGSYPRFLFLDEAFVSSDTERRRAVMNLLKRELRETFDQIFVISHQEDVLREAEHRITMDNGRIVHMS